MNEVGFFFFFSFFCGFHEMRVLTCEDDRC